MCGCTVYIDKNLVVHTYVIIVATVPRRLISALLAFVASYTLRLSQVMHRTLFGKPCCSALPCASAASPRPSPTLCSS